MTKGERHGDDGLKIGRETMQPMYDFVDQAVADKKPFFLWYAPLLPHTPHTPPERLLAKYRGKTPSEHVAKYWAMVEWFDETCGELLKFLDDRKLAENTIVVYVTDNGWIQDPDEAQVRDPAPSRASTTAACARPSCCAGQARSRRRRAMPWR